MSAHQQKRDSDAGGHVTLIQWLLGTVVRVPSQIHDNYNLLEIATN